MPSHAHNTALWGISQNLGGVGMCRVSYPGYVRLAWLLTCPDPDFDAYISSRSRRKNSHLNHASETEIRKRIGCERSPA